MLSVIIHSIFLSLSAVVYVREEEFTTRNIQVRSLVSQHCVIISVGGHAN
jgi:hypothetical protein